VNEKAAAFRRFILPALFFVALLPLSLAAQNRPPSASRHSAAAPSGSEKILFDATNRERAAEDLPPLLWDPALAAAARKHALRMAEERLLEHQYSGEDALRERVSAAGAHFSMAAENIAIGKDAESIHMSWMHSPGHRGNILDPQLTSIGIAAVERRGYVFAAQDFSRAVEALSLDQQETRVAGILKASGFQPVTASEDARKTCADDTGYSGKPTTYIRFETSDLTQLPDGVATRLGNIHSRSAAVGACLTKRTSGFTSYRLAILFF
jgi:uncharacterized protein YkwD